jgi:hypothetical protein
MASCKYRFYPTGKENEYDPSIQTLPDIIIKAG